MIESLVDGVFFFLDCLDDGIEIYVILMVWGDELFIDFVGMFGVYLGNFNVNCLIVIVVMLYCL